MRESDPWWQFIRDCLFVLFHRHYLQEEKAEKAGSDTLTQGLEPESNMDEFLASLKRTEGWAKLSNPSPEQ